MIESLIPSADKYIFVFLDYFFLNKLLILSNSKYPHIKAIFIYETKKKLKEHIE